MPLNQQAGNSWSVRGRGGRERHSKYPACLDKVAVLYLRQRGNKVEKEGSPNKDTCSVHKTVERAPLSDRESVGAKGKGRSKRGRT